mgnify:CR=1 FL=1
MSIKKLASLKKKRFSHFFKGISFFLSIVILANGPGLAQGSNTPQGGSSGAKVTGHTLAEPVNPITVSKWPHLGHYKGQLLLASANWHLVFAGVPPGPLGDPWYPFLLAGYELRNKKWVKIPGLGPMEIKVSKGKKNWFPWAMDTQIIADKNGIPLASQLIISFKGSGKTIFDLHITLSEKGKNLSFFMPQLLAKDSGLRGVKAQFRLFKKAGMVIPFPIDKKNWGLSWQEGESFMGVASYSPLNYSYDGEIIKLSFSYGNVSLPPGFRVLTGKQALQYPWDVYRNFKCFSGKRLTGKNSQQKMESFYRIQGECINSVPFRLVSIFSPGTRDSDVLHQSGGFLKDDKNKLLAWIPFAYGEKTEIKLPTNRLVYLDVNNNGVGSNYQLVSLQKSVDHEVRLPVKVFGQLQINMDERSGPERPAMLRLWREGNNPILPLARVLKKAKSWIPIAGKTFLIKTWPFSLELEAGRYFGSLYRRNGELCSFGAIVGAGHTWQQNCYGPTSLEPSDLSVAEIATQFDGFGQEQLESITGSTIKAGYITKDEEHETNLAVLEVSDPETQISMRFLPVNADSWKKIESHASYKVMNLLKLTAYIRELIPDVFVELVCPKSDVNISAYSQLARTLKPDGIQVIGCGEVYPYKRLLDLVNQMTRAGYPVAMTIASYREMGDSFGYFPAMNFENINVKKDVAQLAGAMKNRSFFINAGAKIKFLPWPEQESIISQQGNRIKFRVRVKSSWYLDPTKLIVYSENKILYQQKFTSKNTGIFDVMVNFSAAGMGRSHRWLRVELIGMRKSTFNLAPSDEKILASSNFLSVTNIKRKKK